ncbi:MAG TPA: hypothetical protein PLC47_10425, partial [Bacteroidales bacterium]|nr:hypothetical protein [Bacteroidales bacterium]
MAHQPAKPQVYAYSLIVLLLLGWPVFGQDFHTQHETTRKASKAFKSAESYYRSGDYQKCFPFLYKATAEDPVFIEAWLMLGDAADEIDSLSLAIDAYEKAYDLSRDFYPGLEYLLASQYVQNQQYDEALNM